VSSDISTELVLNFDYEAQEKNSKGIISDQMADLGYVTTNCILCLETIGPLLFLYYCKVFVWMIVKMLIKYVKYFKETKIIIKFEKLLSKTAFFQDLIVIGLQGYIELLITAILNIKAPLFSPNGELFAFMLSIHSF
jgi:hypothetical protein